MKLIWYLSSLFTIFLILLSNPKAINFGYQAQLFNYTKSSQQNIQLITAISSLVFLFITIILTGNLIN